MGFFDGYRDSIYAYLVVPHETAGNGTAFFPVTYHNGGPQEVSRLIPDVNNDTRFRD